MGTRRVFLFAMLGLALILLWQSWQAQQLATQTVEASRDLAAIAAAQQQLAQPDMPSIGNIDTAVDGSVLDTSAVDTAPIVTVDTDLFQIGISTAGGTLTQLGLKAYPLTVDDGAPPYPLFTTQPDDTFVAQTGLVSTSVAPSHLDTFVPSQTSYTLEDGAQQLRVPLLWRSDNGEVLVTKTYVFTRGSYVIDVEYQVTNNGASRWDGAYYGQFRRLYGKSGSWFMPTFVGGAVYHDKYQKFTLKKMRSENVNIDTQNGWAAMVQHHFFAAFIPPRDVPFHYYSRAQASGDVMLGTRSAAFSVAPGESATQKLSLYAGAKDQSILETLDPIADRLYLTADYGWLAFIARYLFLFLRFIHDLVGSWPLAIVLLTVLIKLAFYKLSETSYRSMAKIRKLTPRIQAIKERVGDDRKRLQQEMMEIYRQEKINPMAGCLPILVQIPVFIALYWVLLESVEMRQSSFLWIGDITLADPLYILPLIMAGTMFLQQRLSPKPPDPVQARVMMFLPVVFSVLFFFFPAGLVLYWIVNNSLSIAQQWFITRRIEQGHDSDKPKSKAKDKRKQ